MLLYKFKDNNTSKNESESFVPSNGIHVGNVLRMQTLTAKNNSYIFIQVHVLCQFGICSWD
jgi:hypothetical protein